MNYATHTNGFTRQLGSVFTLLVRLLSTRSASVLVSLVSFAVVSGVLLSVLMLTSGISRLWTSSGADDVALVVSQNAFAEINSRVSRETVDRIRQAPGLDHAIEHPLSPELLGTVDVPRASDGRGVNIVVRGLVHIVPSVHPKMKLVAGRMFRHGVDEIVVGTKLADTLRNVAVGRSVRIGNHPFRVVGVFAAGGGVAESEIWGDANQFGAAMGTPGQRSVIYAKLDSKASFGAMKHYLESVPGLGVRMYRVSDYAHRQAARYSRLILLPGLLIVLIMAVATMFAAINTMQSSIQARLRELATLRALGFDSTAVMAGLILESVTLGLIGSGIGILVVAACFQNATAITSNGISAFAFTMAFGPCAVVLTIGLAIGLGLAGGIWPSVRAARVRVAHALRVA